MALSTIVIDAIFAKSKPVIYPVTPNGVEHIELLDGGDSFQVIYPVTPNGVEHSRQVIAVILVPDGDLSGNA